MSVGPVLLVVEMRSREVYMVCNYQQRSIPAVVRICWARVVVFLLVLASLAIFPAQAPGATPSIQITTTNPNGSANNGQVMLGSHVALSTILTNQANTSRVWQLQG